MTDPKPANPFVLEMKVMVQRLFRMRHRLRVGLPETIVSLKNRLFQQNRSNPVENFNDFDLFYNVASIMAQHMDSLTMGELSRSLNVPLSTATRVVDWLVAQGYAQRLPDPNDRRVVRVALTDTGSAMYAEIDRFFMERIARLTNAFTPEERSMLLGLLQKVVTTLEEEASSAEPAPKE